MRSGRWVFVLCLVVSCLGLSSTPAGAEITQDVFQATVNNARANIATRSLSVCVIEADGTEWQAVSNKANILDNVGIATKFSIASMTKTFVSACIHELLISKGRTPDATIADVPIGDYLYGVANPPLTSDYLDIVAGNIPIAALLNHTSGIDEYLGTSYDLAVWENTGKVWTPYDILGYVGSSYFDYIPGGSNDYNYTNTNYVVLGMMIEPLSRVYDAQGNMIQHMNAEQAIKSLVLQPNGLMNTYFRGFETIPDPKAEGYEKGLSGFYKSSTFVGDGTALYTSSWTCGYMVSDSLDMARWSRIYYDYLSGIYSEMATMPLNFKENNTGFSIYYGAGIMRLTRTDIPNCVLWGHTGTIPGFNGIFAYWPDRQYAIAILMNEHYADRFKVLRDIVTYLNNPS